MEPVIGDFHWQDGMQDGYIRDDGFGHVVLRIAGFDRSTVMFIDGPTWGSIVEHIGQLKVPPAAIPSIDPDEVAALQGVEAGWKAAPASPSEISDVLNAAAEILLGWGYHDSYAESGRGQIAVQELRGLADRLAALRTTKEGEGDAL